MCIYVERCSFIDMYIYVYIYIHITYMYIHIYRNRFIAPQGHHPYQPPTTQPPATNHQPPDPTPATSHQPAAPSLALASPA